MRTRGVRIRLAALRDLVMIGRAVVHGYLFGTPRCTYTAHEFTAVCGALAEAEGELARAKAELARWDKWAEQHGPYRCQQFID